MTDINFEELAKSVGKAIGRQRHQVHIPTHGDRSITFMPIT
ncbi:hypothetical protein ACB289_14555 [Aeromonas caviae]